MELKDDSEAVDDRDDEGTQGQDDDDCVDVDAVVAENRDADEDCEDSLNVWN